MCVCKPYAELGPNNDCSMIHCVQECSQQGVCVYNASTDSTQCNCFYPTITGEGCEQCASGFSGPNCTVGINGRRRDLEMLPAAAAALEAAAQERARRTVVSPDPSLNISLAHMMCKCVTGRKGDFCEQIDCPGEPDCLGRGTCLLRGSPVCSCKPGFGGPDCGTLICPGTPTCSGRGQCLLPAGASAPSCDCDNSFAGSACETCDVNYDGINCERCVTNYVGWARDACQVYCVHGYATPTPQSSNCTCYSDTTNGYW